MLKGEGINKVKAFKNCFNKTKTKNISKIKTNV